MESAYSKQLWAPELHRIHGRWYIYVAADDGDNHHHRIYVLENRENDPASLHWKLLGKLNTQDDSWAIDLTAFEYKGKWYAVWAGWPGTENGVQNLYISRMKKPWKLEGKRILLSTPTYAWETKGDLNKPDGAARHVNINEGPEVLQHDGRVFLTYSASACWEDEYALGMLTLAPGGDPMDPKAWTKSSQPVFASDAAAHAFGTGHNGFFTSPDGKQNWIVYHANPAPHMGCGGKRATRVQPFTWNADGTPHFGTPVPLGETIPSPSGEEAK
ncbi:MAG: glycoside hydrolase family 43 protein [Acidobacteria bacterium]|nr:glycoside hydrolase family 43 protein [Acidobacteriota bacterium]